MKNILLYLLVLTFIFLGACNQVPEQNNQLSHQQAVDQEQTMANNNVWHAAKLRGVSFRAIGQEPAWLLEIYPNEKILLHRNYGDKVDEFIYQTPKVEQEKRRSTFSLDQQGTVTIEGIPCSDIMSGEKFETTVTLMLEDQMLKGCGRALY